MIEDLEPRYRRSYQTKTTILPQLLAEKRAEARENYIRKSNYAKKMVKEAQQNSWDKLVSVIENDVHSRQQCAYKIMKSLNRVEKDSALLDIISDNE